MIWALGNKFVSILEYDKEWEEKKLRKAEYEAGKSEGIEIGKSEGIEIGRDKIMAEIICNMINVCCFQFFKCFISAGKVFRIGICFPALPNAAGVSCGRPYVNLAV